MGVYFPDRHHGTDVFLLRFGALTANSAYSTPERLPVGALGCHRDDTYLDTASPKSRQFGFPAEPIADEHPDHAGQNRVAA